MSHGDTPRPAVWTVPVRIIVLIGLTSAALFVVTVAVGSGDSTDTATLVARIVGGCVVSTVVVTSVLGLRRLVGPPGLGELGLGPPVTGWRGLLVGALAWLVPAALAFGLLATRGSPLSVTAPAEQFWSVLVLLLLAVLLAEAVPEETVFRGYVTSVLAERLPEWWVVVVQTALFTGTAVALRGGVGVLDLSLFIAMGIVLGYLRMVTGSVWVTIGFHMAFQTGSQLVLTHDVVEFAGAATHAMLALGAVPFTVASIVLPLLVAGSGPGGSVVHGSRARPSPDEPSGS